MRDNSGSMRRNERKEKQTHPDMKGKATIGGVEYWISGWVKQSDDGKWISLAFDRKDAERKKVRNDDGPDDDLPW